MGSSAHHSSIRSQLRRIVVVCPQCNQRYKIASRLAGRRLVCKKCRHQWRARKISSSELSGQLINRNEEPSDSGRVGLWDDLPPEAGSGSIAIDMSWAGRQIGRYRARSLLGYGGMGVVWRAHDDTLRRDVALKILSQTKKKHHSGGLNTDLFKQEARAVAKLQHPAVVSIYEVAEDQGHLFLSLELMEGGTLKEYVDCNGPIHPRSLFKMLVGPAQALALAHRQGIVHRDIKPSNLMFDDHGHLKLMDFGLADVSHEEISERLRGKAVGSLGWVAPETARGEATTPQSDLYSFGLVMLYALTGQPFIHAKSRSAILHLHRHPPELKLHEIKGLTTKGKRLMRQCLAVTQTDRFASAEELVEALQVCTAEDPVAKRERRRSGVSIAVAASIMGVILGLGGAFWFLLNLQNQEDEFHQPTVAVRPSAPSSPTRLGNIDPYNPLASPPVANPHATLISGIDLRVPWPEILNGKDLKIVASRYEHEFHLASAPCGRGILASDLLNYASNQDAMKDGLKPCPLCHPDSPHQSHDNLALSPESED